MIIDSAYTPLSMRRAISVGLSLLLATPSPAFAMRQTNASEGASLDQQLVNSLVDVPQSKSSLPGVSQPATLEISRPKSPSVRQGKPLVLKRVPLGDLAEDLDQALTRRGESRFDTAAYGQARVFMRIVQNDEATGTAALLGAWEWVSAQPVLQGNLVVLPNWNYEDLGPGLVQVSLARYQTAEGKDHLLIERVEVLAGVDRLDHSEEISGRLSLLLEAIGEWGRARGIPVHLIQPDLIQKVLPNMREATRLRNYEESVDGAAWESAPLKISGSLLTTLEGEAFWFLYKGKAGMEEPEVSKAPVLMRVKMGDLADKLDQYLIQYGEIQRDTEHYGRARVALRFVDRDKPFNIIGAIALNEWVETSPELNDFLVRNLLWQNYFHLGRALVHVYLDRYEDEQGKDAIVIERVQILAGPLNLEHPDEIEIRSEIIEAIGEWGKRQGMEVYLIRPEQARGQRPDIRQKTIQYNYYLPVADREPRRWETVPLILRRSHFTDESKEFNWYRYIGRPAQPPAAAQLPAEPQQPVVPNGPEAGLEEIGVRPVQNRDDSVLEPILGQVIQLRQQAGLETKQSGKDGGKGFFREMIRNPDLGVLVVANEGSGRVVGYALAEVRVRALKDFPASIGQISELVLLPAYRDAKTSRNLLASAQAHFEKQGIGISLVSADDPDEPIVAAARSLGYEPVPGVLFPSRYWRALRPEFAAGPGGFVTELRGVEVPGVFSRNLAGWLKTNGRFSWKTERYGNMEAQMQVGQYDRVQVFPYGDFQSHPELQVLQFNGGGDYAAAPGAFGQILVSTYLTKQGRIAVLIQEARPGDGYKKFNQLQCRTLDVWRRGAIDLIADWARGNNFLVYAATPEIVQFVYPDLSEYNLRVNFGRWDEGGPFEPSLWMNEVVMVHASSVSEAQYLAVPMRWYSYAKNQEVMKLPLRRVDLPKPVLRGGPAGLAPSLEENPSPIQAVVELLSQADGRFAVGARRGSDLIGFGVAEIDAEAPSVGRISEFTVQQDLQTVGIGARIFQELLWSLMVVPGVQEVRVNDSSDNGEMARIAGRFDFKQTGVGGSAFRKEISAVPLTIQGIEIHTAKTILESYLPEYSSRLTEKQQNRIEEFMGRQGARAVTATLDLTVVPVYVQSSELYKVAKEHLPGPLAGVAFRLAVLPETEEELRRFNWGEIGLILENEMLDSLKVKPEKMASVRVYPTAEAVSALDPVQMLVLIFRNTLNIPPSQNVQGILFTDLEGRAHFILMYA